ncbi:hypothetical protein C450_20621 [Halococcus salifodinae DSM 8989]|uniref:Uncharacterized protein n=1 Tax=Halococcus salifodinae DSM 8989 TaxID=1227456 RepID=M0MQ47_9EURY|nr:hypothetical protein C450_20621 [Halococcus salifodinae DSM 8989]
MNDLREGWFPHLRQETGRLESRETIPDLVKAELPSRCFRLRCEIVEGSRSIVRRPSERCKHRGRRTGRSDRLLAAHHLHRLSHLRAAGRFLDRDGDRELRGVLVNVSVRETAAERIGKLVDALAHDHERSDKLAERIIGIHCWRNGALTLVFTRFEQLAIRGRFAVS